jgi:diacylglycerol O-acyltransferase
MLVPLPIETSPGRGCSRASVLPLKGNGTLGVGALSYARQFAIAASAGRDACPDLDVFAAKARNEPRALASSAMVPVARRTTARDRQAT